MPATAARPEAAVPNQPPAEHIRRGADRVIQRGTEREALRGMEHPVFGHFSDDHATKVQHFNEVTLGGLRKRREERDQRIADFTRTPEMIDLGDVFAFRDVVDQSVLEELKAQLEAATEGHTLAAESIADLASRLQELEGQLPQVEKLVAKKLDAAGITPETTQAGRAGTNAPAAKRQFDFQVRQHRDYVAATGDIQNCHAELQAAREFEKRAAELVDLATGALRNHIEGIVRHHCQNA